MESESTQPGAATASKLIPLKVCSTFASMKYLNLFSFTGRALGNGDGKQLGLGEEGECYWEKMAGLSALLHGRKTNDIHLDSLSCLLLLHHFKV